MKKFDIGLKPGADHKAEEWIRAKRESADEEARRETPARMKRLTIDVPEDLHRTLKVKAAEEGVKMADLVRRWIEEGCGEPA